MPMNEVPASISTSRQGFRPPTERLNLIPRDGDTASMALQCKITQRGAVLRCSVRFNSDDVRGDSAYPFSCRCRILVPSFIVICALNLESAPRNNLQYRLPVRRVDRTDQSPSLEWESGKDRLLQLSIVLRCQRTPVGDYGG